jgi:hypothetical protein
MGNENVLAMVDVSGSMSCPAGRNMSITCLTVAMSIGLYAADKMSGAFKDTFLTFSGQPELLHLKGDLLAKLAQMNNSAWGMNTDVMAAFRLVLNHAVANKVPQEDMPSTVVILSDMQFDQCASFSGAAFDKIKQAYAAAGYVAPKVVFWNLNASYGNVPVKSNAQGVILVSGFSPALFKQILAAKEVSPYAMMMEVIGQERYAKVVV